jgi:hypothetical protein
MPPSLLCGYGEAVITPPRGVDLCGYGFYLNRKAKRVRDDLKARALYLRRGEASAVIVACDLIGLTVELSNAIREAIAQSIGLPRASVLLACTHTHSGPAVHPMPGLGDVAPGFAVKLRAFVVEAAERAERDARPAGAAWASEMIEPIGYNRRAGDFRDIDPLLKTIVFDRGGDRIHLWSYACHAVVLGPGPEISADWPGAAAAALEARGRRGVFLQGFCGDIDPVTQAARWGGGTGEDLELYGQIIAGRLVRAESRAAALKAATVEAAETRVALPLQVYSAARIGRFAASFAKRYDRFPGAARFAREWEVRALAERADWREDPRLLGIPVQALAIGSVKIAALPGEIFAGYAAAWRHASDPIMPVGFANGVVGYIPTSEAYDDPSDYAAWCAPMIYGVFPFRPDAGTILLKRVKALLRGL